MKKKKKIERVYLFNRDLSDGVWSRFLDVLDCLPIDHCNGK